MTKNIVIVGAGQAACSFVARFRSLDSDSRLILIGDEPVYPYQRPPLSKKYALGEMEPEQLQLRAEDWYGENNIHCMLGNPVATIDRNAKTLILSDGQTINWDELFLATGSRARSLPDSIGGELDGVYMLRSAADADAMRQELVTDRQVVIIGGGYIGLEAAASAASLGLKVTVVEAAERILQRVACQETSDFFRKLHQDHGVTIHENTGLERIEELDGRASTVILSNGEQIPVDFVLVGIGIIPNAELATAAELEVAGGIMVDSHCRTTDPHIYAAGDCAAFTYRDQLTRIESVQNAIDQAECAADNMAGQVREYLPYPWFWSDQYEVKLQIAGLNRGYDRIVVRPGNREGALSHWYFTGNTFIAVDAMNDPRSYMVGKKLLETGKIITPKQASDTSLELKTLL